MGNPRRKNQRSGRSENSPTNDEGRIMNYHSFPDNEMAASFQSTEYRGFSSSINDLFSDPEYERVDCCAMACCGVLQNDRDRYLISGILPPSCCRRFWIHIVLPLWIFAVAMFCAVKVPDVYLNELLSTGFVLILLGYFVFQCMKGMWKRREIRKELLWSKYNSISTGTFRPRYDDDSIDGAPDYLMGQTGKDIRNAHALCGCYSSDRPSDALADPPKKDLCSQCFGCYSQTCCGSLCGLHLQLCGVCAVAQEARELEGLIDRRIAIDYVTMQNMMDYYPAIYEGRHQTNDSAVSFPPAFWVRLSSFSRWAVGSSAAVVLVLLIWSLLGYHRDFHLENYLVFCATLLQAFIIMKLVHWRHTKDISTDALVKFFVSGFFLSTSLAVFYEVVTGLTVRFVMSLLMALSGIDVVESEGYNLLGLGFARGPSYADLLIKDEVDAPSGYRDYLQVYGRDHPIIYIMYLIVSSFILAALIEELSKYFGFRMIEHPDFFSRGEIEDALKAVEDKEQKETDALDFSRQERSLESRAAATTIAMVATALGFACCENLVYIFIYGEATFSVQLFVLIARSLFPIHPIAAALQSIKVCERDFEKKGKIGIGTIILTGFLFHGLYDFILMLVEFLGSRNANYVEDDDGVMDDDFKTLWLSFLLSVGVMFAGLWYFFTESNKQRGRLRAMDQRSSVDQSRLL